MQRISIYTKANCVYCEYTKNLLELHKVKYDEFKLDIDFTRENLLEMYAEARSFPVVVVDGFHIGGYEQLKTILNEETKNTSKLLNEGV